MKFDGHRWIAVMLILMTGAATGVYLQQREQELQEHAAYSSLLLNLKEQENCLSREILGVTSFQADQHGVLAKCSNSLRLLLKELKQLSVASNGVGSMPLKKVTDEYLAHATQKLALIERIESRAVLIRDDLRYLPVLVEQHDGQTGQSTDSLATLLNRIFRYNLFPGEIDPESLEQHVAAMQTVAGTPAQQQKLEEIRSHMQAVLRNMQSLETDEKELARISSGRHLEALYAVADGYREQEMQAYSRLGLLVLVLIVELVLAILYLLGNLRSARSAAEDSRKRLLDGLSNLSEAFAMFDPRGRLVIANQTWEEFYPWLRGNFVRVHILGRDRKTKFNPYHAQNLVGQQTRCRGFCAVRQTLLRGKSRREKWYLASDSKTEEGGLVCVRSDITESKRVEHQFRKMSRALEQSPASIVITDTDGIIEYVNPRFEEISGYSAEESIGKNSRLLKSDDKTAEEYKALWDTLKQGKVWRGTFYSKRKDGNAYWESACVSPIRDEQGKITHYIEVKEDVTAHRQSEDQLRMNATVFETTTEGIMVTDEQGRIKAVNPAFTDIMGYSSEEAVGQMPNFYASGRHDKAFFAEMWDRLNEAGSWAGEIWNRRKDGSVFPEWLSIAAIRDEFGIINEYVAIFSDITQRKQDEEQILYQANYDVLTGLPNRSLLFDRLLQSIVSARREGRISP